jgi:hypothetical protein
MKNQIRKVEFTSQRVGATIKFKVDVQVKESFLQRLANLFKSEKTVSVWMEENQASSASNYLYNEIKKLKKSFVVKEEAPKEDWEINMEKTVGKVSKEAPKKAPKKKAEKKEENAVVAEGTIKPKSTRRYNRKPKKEQAIQSEK